MGKLASPGLNPTSRQASALCDVPQLPSFNKFIHRHYASSSVESTVLYVKFERIIFSQQITLRTIVVSEVEQIWRIVSLSP